MCTRCADPTILTPGTTDLHDALTHQFHKLMGTSIYSAEEQCPIAFHKGAYEDHLRSEQTYKNNPRITSGRALTPLPSEDIEVNRFKKFAWTVVRIPYHMFRGAATVLATMAQKGTPSDFEDIELTNKGLSETWTRSPPSPYNPTFRQRVAN